MTVSPGATSSASVDAGMEWGPVAVIALAQMLAVSNSPVTGLAIGGIVAEFATPVTTVQTALVAAWLVTAAFMLLGGRLALLHGARRMFRIALLLYAAGMAGMALSSSPRMIVGAEIIIGLAAATLVPTLIALIAANYDGRRRVLALGILTAASGAGVSVAVLVGGAVNSLAGWRAPFWLLSGVAVVILLASLGLRPSKPGAGMEIDWIGAALSGLAIPLLTIGINNVDEWGVLVASAGAPARPFGLSPAALSIASGLLLSGAFVAWMRRRVARGRAPLLSPIVLDSASKRGALAAQLAGVGVYGSIVFLLPLYTQIVLGISPLGSSLRLLPYAIALLVASVSVSRLLTGRSVRRLTRVAFGLMASGLTLCALALRSPLHDALFGLGLIVAGAGTGLANTLLANVLVSSSPRAVSSEVGAVRGTANNLGAAFGASVSGLVLGAVLSATFVGGLTGAEVGAALRGELGRGPGFVSDQRMALLAEEAGAAAGEAAAVMEANAAARLAALQAAFFLLVGIALVGLLAVSPLPSALPESDPRGTNSP
jgi:MFS family permease